MIELLNTIEEILKQAALPGGILDGITVLVDEHEGLKERNVVVKPTRQSTLSQSGVVKYCQGEVLLACCSQVGKNAKKEEWRDKRADCIDIARLVSKVIGQNPTLVSATYPNGFTQRGEATEIFDEDYFTDTVNSAWYYFARPRLRAKYIYRDGVIALK